MINRGNIRSYIEFLHYKKYDIGPKEELLERWVHLSDFEITKQLSGLYQHWEILAEVAQKYERAFLEQSEKVAIIIPPPLTVPSHPINTDEGDYSRYTKESSNQAPKLIAIALVCVLVVGGILYFVNQQTELTQKTEQLDQKIQQVDQTATIEQQAKLQKEEAAKRSEQERLDKIKEVKDNIETYVSRDVHYNYDATFGGIKNVSVSVRNNSDFKLDELTIRLYYIKKNGELHETKDAIFYNVPPHESKQMSGPSSNRGMRLEAKIAGVQIVK